MKPGGGGKKGQAYERELCSKLSLWWSKGKDDAIFYRTGGSGGRATRRGRAGKSTVNHCGDVGAADPVGMPLMKLCAIEIKRGYNSVTPHDIIDAPAPKKGKDPASPPFADWMAQAHESSVHANAIGWLIIAKRDSRREYVVLSESALKLLPMSLDSSLFWSSITHPMYGNAYIMRLESFLLRVTPDDVRYAVRDQ